MIALAPVLDHWLTPQIENYRQAPLGILPEPAKPSTPSGTYCTSCDVYGATDRPCWSCHVGLVPTPGPFPFADPTP